MSQQPTLSQTQGYFLQKIVTEATLSSNKVFATFTRLFINSATSAVTSKPPQLALQALHDLTDGKVVACALQRFSSQHFNGYALVTITKLSFRDLAQQRDADIYFDRDGNSNIDVNTDEIALNLMAEFSNEITHSNLAAIATQLKLATPEIAKPEIISLNIAINDIRIDAIADWPLVHSINTLYSLKNHPFNCSLLLMLPESITHIIPA